MTTFLDNQIITNWNYKTNLHYKCTVNNILRYEIEKEKKKGGWCKYRSDETCKHDSEHAPIVQNI